MGEKGIIAAWISPARLFDFIACNQLMNMVFIAIKYLLIVLNEKQVASEYFIISGEAEKYFNYFFKGYGLVMAILGISLVILSKIGKLGGIDGKRTARLFILGIVNVIESIYFMVEVLL